ncbi:TetR/AcrR family transcriptional regulator [Roseateles sp. DAIF2]|uniref:TetR/AcrR family transcriptional regulator n=1 Tax=Roseateles sp. DAIF2 TaxID=2714952 RepID=UPI0018A2CB3E|nr:TetR/AcrR family transcriptional regulator [Roseateles sp. DAIF2]QPF75580.1 TetR/AcrR family transcriptional regulator [Roseateles sp. DAIF2]
MSSETTSPTRLTDRKREAIVLAAMAEFREHGFAGTSMDRLAAVAGVSKRTVYNHFPSKDELFAAVLLQLFERSQALAGLAYSPARPLREQLLELLAQKMALLNDASFMALSRVAVAEMMHVPERAEAMVGRLAEKEAGLANWLRAAQQDGRLRPLDPQYATQQLQGLLKAFAFWPQLAMGQPPLDLARQRQVLEDSVDMFLSFYSVADPG